jgi:hypothetical protein
MAANLRLTSKLINAILSMSFLQNYTQAGREEQMKIPLADSEESGQKKMIIQGTQEEIDNGVLLLNLTPGKVLKGCPPLDVFIDKRVHLLLEFSLLCRFQGQRMHFLGPFCLQDGSDRI